MKFSILFAALFSVGSAQAESSKVYPESSVPTRGVQADSFEPAEKKMIGAWAATSHIGFGIADAEYFLRDGETHTGTNPPYATYLVAKRLFSSSGLGLASQQPDGSWLLLFDSSTSYYKLYRYSTLSLEIDGRYWLYQKTSQPSGTGSWMRGFRMLDYSEVAAVPGKKAPAGSEKVPLSTGDSRLDSSVGHAVAHMSAELSALRAK